MTETLPLAAYRAHIGREFGVSGWQVIDQAMIDAFADLTGDHQFIHVDPIAAAATPLGGTVAHGFLTLSLFSRLAEEVIPRLAGAVFSLNYGFDKVRFLTPVRSGSRVRGRFGLREVRDRNKGEILLVFDAVVEIEGQDKPALAAEWLGLEMMPG
jgi:acyl dehydratase